jgi:hypothetical protein
MPQVARTAESWVRYLVMFVCVLGAPLRAGNPEPFWKANPIDLDPLFFVKEEGQELASAQLLYTPITAPILRSSTGDTNYSLGKDFTWQSGSRLVRLTPTSSIPFKTHAELFPKKGTPGTIGPARGKENTNLFFGEGHVFHDLQAVASYRHRDRWDGKVPSATGNLPKTKAKLKEHAPLKVVVLGDSISTGANASGAVNA